MDDRSNTIAGWVLGGGIVALGLSIVSGMYFHGEAPEKEGFAVVAEVASDAGGAAAEVPIATLACDCRCRQRVRLCSRNAPLATILHRAAPMVSVQICGLP